MNLDFRFFDIYSTYVATSLNQMDTIIICVVQLINIKFSKISVFDWFEVDDEWTILRFIGCFWSSVIQKRFYAAI